MHQLWEEAELFDPLLPSLPAPCIWSCGKGKAIPTLRDKAGAAGFRGPHTSPFLLVLGKALSVVSGASAAGHALPVYSFSAELSKSLFPLWVRISQFHMLGMWLETLARPSIYTCQSCFSRESLAQHSCRKKMRQCVVLFSTGSQGNFNFSED